VGAEESGSTSKEVPAPVESAMFRAVTEPVSVPLVAADQP
jgi:hypothetical protein